MMFHDNYRAAMREEIAKNERELGEGKADSFEEYKRRVGLISGLRKANDVFNDTLKNYIEDDDDK